MKYRIWSKNAQCYTHEPCYPGSSLHCASNYYLDSDGNIVDFVTTIGGNQDDATKCDVDQEAYIIEQYTGLHDSKGNKIFEGDILYFVAKYIYTEPVEVIYYGSSYGCITHDERGTLKEYTELNHIVQQYHPEVIGNRHQLPCQKPNAFDHNGECIHCDCWLSDCPLLKKST
jgi:hypothetical protein